MTELTAPRAGVLELLRLFGNDQAAADRYAGACLENAKAVEPRLKAFEYFPQSTARRPGPLSGIPVAIKDIIATSDMPTTNGSPIYRDHVPSADAWVVERLRQLGAREDRSSGRTFLAIAAEHEVDVSNPRLGDDVYLALNRVFVDTSTVSFGLANPPIETVLGGGRSLADPRF